MRTTVTLDEDVFDALRDRAHARREPFKRVLNDALRRELRLETPAAKPFKQQTSSHRAQPGMDLNKAMQLAADLEVEETVRKLSQGR